MYSKSSTFVEKPVDADFLENTMYVARKLVSPSLEEMRGYMPGCEIDTIAVVGAVSEARTKRSGTDVERTIVCKNLVGALFVVGISGVDFKAGTVVVFRNLEFVYSRLDVVKFQAGEKRFAPKGVEEQSMFGEVKDTVGVGSEVKEACERILGEIAGFGQARARSQATRPVSTRKSYYIHGFEGIIKQGSFYSKMSFEDGSEKISVLVSRSDTEVIIARAMEGCAGDKVDLERVEGGGAELDRFNELFDATCGLILIHAEIEQAGDGGYCARNIVIDYC